MISRLLKLTIAIAALLLMAVYFYMNSIKLELTANDWASIRNGDAAPEIQIYLSGEVVYQQRLKDSEIFDKAGRRQIYFVHLPKDIFVRIQAETGSASLDILQQKTTLSKTNDKSALFAVTPNKRIYLLEEGELKYMLTVIWNERLQSGNLVQCATPRLCKSLKITSNDWGPVQGPFSGSEFSTERRGLPKGRWAKGPETVLQIDSRETQKVWMQINLLGVLADQTLRFRGAATGVQKIEADPDPQHAGGRDLYPAVYLVALDLRPGVNYLEISFSKWSKPVSQGANPLAAYVAAIGLQEAD